MCAHDYISLTELKVLDLSRSVCLSTSDLFVSMCHANLLVRVMLGVPNCEQKYCTYLHSWEFLF